MGRVPSGSCMDFVDKAGCLSAHVKRELEELGWKVTEFHQDVFRWGENLSASYDLCFASLFLHHFEEDQLKFLFNHISQKINHFICVEPRRNQFGLFGAAGLRLLKCDPITLHDAKISVQAGFHHQELSAIWSQSDVSKWNLEEHPAGLFSHFFSASSSGS